MKNYLSLLDMKRIPAHVAIIMDGNGRWARKKSLPRTEGHRRGSEVIESIIDASLLVGIKVVSLYAFSTENWSRPRSEISFLWSLMESFFETHVDAIKDKGVRLAHSGVLKGLPSSTKRVINNALSQTKRNKKMILNFCLNYGGRQEIVDAVNGWAEKCGPKERISASKINRQLYTSGLPDVDLLIRTSGEYRISNFLIWQCAYAELVFLKTLWPDFRPSHLYRAIYDYQKRERRFGGL